MVTFSWFTNGTCATPPVEMSDPFTLAGGVLHATAFAFTPGVSGSFAFQATYSGGQHVHRLNRRPASR